MYGGGLVTKSCLTLVTPWTVARQAPLSTGFSRQEYWSGLPFPSPGDLPDPGIEPRSSALQADSLPTELWGKPDLCIDPLYRRVQLIYTSLWLIGKFSSLSTICLPGWQVLARPLLVRNITVCLLHWGSSSCSWWWRAGKEGAWPEEPTKCRERVGLGGKCSFCGDLRLAHLAEWAKDTE